MLMQQYPWSLLYGYACELWHIGLVGIVATMQAKLQGRSTAPTM